jgi:hypothetical protein
MTSFRSLAWTLTGLMAVFLFGCAFGQTSSTPEDEIAAYSAQKNGSAEALDELGWSPSHKLSPDEEDALNKRIELRNKEARMSDMREREQYFKFKPFLDNDDERISFLNLPNVESRDRYAMEKGIYYHANKFAPPVRDAVSRSDIILGMNKDAVVESWGEPAAVEIAGQANYENEKWRYIDYVETAEGYQREERIVIFENGKVAGWQKN